MPLLPPVLLASYEPDEPEGSTAKKSQYMSAKEIKVIAVLLVIFGAIAFPLFKAFLEERHEQACKKNLKNISSAILLYADDNDHKFPPLFNETADGIPSTFDGGLTVWASHLPEYGNHRISFACPAADESENTHVLDFNKGGGETMELSYGMYVAMGLKETLKLANPNSTALIIETSNHGAMNSYNPKPFLLPNGEPYPDDGFIVGYDNDNWQHTNQTVAVTRLAFRNANGPDNYLGKKVIPRHPQGINVIYASGGLGLMKPNHGRVNHLYPNLVKPWQNR